MRKLFQTWKSYFDYLIEEDVIISYYTFFTVIFAECAYLWAFHAKLVPIGLTVVLFAYIVNAIVFSCLKNIYEGERQELIMARLYVVCFIVIFIVGCIINFWLNVILTAIPVVITYLWIGIREFQDHDYEGYDGIIGAIVRLFENKVFWIISQVVVIGVPYFAFILMLALIPNIAVVIKIVIVIIYLICAPFIAYVPCIDLCSPELAYWDIFGIAYDISYYDCEKEKKRESRLQEKWYNSKE